MMKKGTINRPGRKALWGEYGYSTIERTASPAYIGSDGIGGIPARRATSRTASKAYCENISIQALLKQSLAGNRYRNG
jgi:hypothetical protein